MDAPLAGVRVVEVAHFVAVPAAGALLADLGADVVKIELPSGEIYRHGRPYPCETVRQRTIQTYRAAGTSSYPLRPLEL